MTFIIISMMNIHQNSMLDDHLRPGWTSRPADYGLDVPSTLEGSSMTTTCPDCLGLSRIVGAEQTMPAKLLAVASDRAKYSTSPEPAHPQCDQHGLNGSRVVGHHRLTISPCSRRIAIACRVVV